MHREYIAGCTTGPRRSQFAVVGDAGIGLPLERDRLVLDVAGEARRSGLPWIGEMVRRTR